MYNTKNISVFMPCFVEEKYQTKAYTSKGEAKLFEKNFEVFIKHIFYKYGVSIRTNQGLLSQFLNRSRLIPIYIPSGEILIPFKVATPYRTYPTLHGYVFFHEIREFRPYQIILRSGVVLDTLDSYEVLSERLAESQQIQVLHETGFKHAFSLGRDENWIEPLDFPADSL